MTTRRRGERRWRSPALAVLVLVGFGAAAPAHAQFSFFGSREASPEDVGDTIAEHGFRLVGPLYRNGRVYLADVIDRRQRRERLVISAESGRIVQRFMVDVGPERREATRQPPRDESFFSHLTRGWDDEPPPRPPLGVNGPDDLPPAMVPPVAPRPKPKVATRTETAPVTAAPPVTASPLPPPSAAPAPQQAAPATKPEVVAVPAPSAAPSSAPASNVRGTSVASDPLRIPGTRKGDEAKSTPSAAVATKAVEPAPKVKSAAPGDVPVAPLD